jgi:DNA-binding NarL/FixJ family response regulator
MSETIRILIADDHAIVREGLRSLLATEPGFELVAEASDGV